MRALWQVTQYLSSSARCDAAVESGAGGEVAWDATGSTAAAACAGLGAARTRLEPADVAIHVTASESTSARGLTFTLLLGKF